MNTDKIIAESIAKDYAPKESSKLVALKKLDNKAKLPATVSPILVELSRHLYLEQVCVLLCRLSVVASVV